jgi:hypothetical protein
MAHNIVENCVIYKLVQNRDIPVLYGNGHEEFRTLKNKVWGHPSWLKNPAEGTVNLM